MKADSSVRHPTIRDQVDLTGGAVAVAVIANIVSRFRVLCVVLLLDCFIFFYFVELLYYLFVVLCEFGLVYLRVRSIEKRFVFHIYFFLFALSFASRAKIFHCFKIWSLICLSNSHNFWVQFTNFIRVPLCGFLSQRPVIAAIVVRRRYLLINKSKLSQRERSSARKSSSSGDWVAWYGGSNGSNLGIALIF